MAIDGNKLQQLMDKMFGDVGAAMGSALVLLGDKFGLYKMLAADGPLTAAELASKTGTVERYVREWAAQQAAAGYINYDAKSARFSISPEQALVLADENGPAFIPAMFEIVAATLRDEPKIANAFRNGGGVGWHEHDPSLFRGTERFFRPGYAMHLVSEWIPALDGVREKLERGARVADVGCGHGASVILMAKAFPKSKFFGFDYHQPSIDRAREIARAEGIADRAVFERATAKDYPGTFDLVAFFDCLHDMGDPVGAAAHVKSSLAADGTWMVVEPFGNDRLEDNLNPIGRVFYAASTMICVPGSLSQEVGKGLGAQAGESRLREVLTAGGFSRVRRAAATPFNLVLEARP
jgi:SAM-dependent methyltransferase